MGFHADNILTGFAWAFALVETWDNCRLRCASLRSAVFIHFELVFSLGQTAAP